MRTYKSVKTKSSADGKYEFKTVPDAGEYQIAIDSKRWVGITDRTALPHVGLSPTTQVVRDFVLPRACQVRIHTVDEKGKPISGVTVLSSLAAENQNFAAMAMTDKEGWATLSGLKPSADERLIATMGRWPCICADEAQVNRSERRRGTANGVAQGKGG